MHFGMLQRSCIAVVQKSMRQVCMHAGMTFKKYPEACHKMDHLGMDHVHHKCDASYLDLDNNSNSNSSDSDSDDDSNDK